jgi:hypothetical protein
MDEDNGGATLHHTKDDGIDLVLLSHLPAASFSYVQQKLWGGGDGAEPAADGDVDEPEEAKLSCTGCCA